MTIDARFSTMAELMERTFGGHPVRRFLAFHIDSLTEGHCTMSIQFEPEFDNTTGAVHGGILSMLADTAAACALATQFEGEMNFATSNLNIHFLRRASTTVTANATVIKKGARISVVSTALHDSDGRQVATAICEFVPIVQRDAAARE